MRSLEETQPGGKLMSMSKTFIGTVCRGFKSEAPVAEEMLDRVVSYAVITDVTECEQTADLYQ